MTAFQQVHECFGEPPQTKLFDPPLENAIRAFADSHGDEFRNVAIWVLECIEE